MTTMHDVDILTMLQGGVLAALTAADVSHDRLKVVGRTFTPPDDQQWFEIVWIPNNPVGDFWGPEKNYEGLFRLILHTANDDTGAYPPMTLLASVASYFDKERQLGAVKITEEPTLSSPLEGDAETLYVASMRYRSFRP
jgi:hypothetical protein